MSYSECFFRLASTLLLFTLAVAWLLAFHDFIAALPMTWQGAAVASLLASPAFGAMGVGAHICIRR